MVEALIFNWPCTAFPNVAEQVTPKTTDLTLESYHSVKALWFVTFSKCPNWACNVSDELLKVTPQIKHMTFLQGSEPSNVHL